MVARFRHYQNKDRFLAMLVIAFHVSIILFLISFGLLLFTPSVAAVAAALAIAFLVFFIAGGFFRKQAVIDGNNFSPLKMVISFKDHSVILVVLFLLLSIYTGLNRVGVLPGIYSDEYPQAYFELINEGPNRRQKTTDGEYKYQEFLNKYKEFLKHNVDYVK
jgi:hypothetical protein